MKKKISFSTVFTYMLCAVALSVVIFTAVKLYNSSTDDQETETTSFFGYNCFVVLSGSMEKEFPVGSVIVSKSVEAETIKVGDIISFMSIDPSYMDEVVSHKIRSITQYNGELAFETYGTTTGVSDGMPALSSKILGKYQFTIPYIGKAVLFIQGDKGFLIFIIVPLFIVFVLQVIKLIKILVSKDDDEEGENKDNDDEAKKESAEDLKAESLTQEQVKEPIAKEQEEHDEKPKAEDLSQEQIEELRAKKQKRTQEQIERLKAKGLTEEQIEELQAKKKRQKQEQIEKLRAKGLTEKEIEELLAKKKKQKQEQRAIKRKEEEYKKNNQI